MMRLGRCAAVLLLLLLLCCVPLVHVGAQTRWPPPPPHHPPPPPSEPRSGGGVGASCVDVLTWPCWMVGNASAWNKADTSGSSYSRLELCENNRFVWAGQGDENSVHDEGPTLRAKDACCVCQPDTVGTPQPQDSTNTDVATIVETRRPYGRLFVEDHMDDKNQDIACEVPTFISYNTGVESGRFPMENSMRGYTWCDDSTCDGVTGADSLSNSYMSGPGYYLLTNFGDYDACVLAARPDEVIEEDSYCEDNEGTVACGVATSPLCTGDAHYRDEEDETTARVEEEERAEEEMGEQMDDADRLEELEGVRDEERLEARISSCLSLVQQPPGTWQPKQCYAPPSLFPNPSCATVPGCQTKQLHLLADGTLCNACGAGVVCDNENRDFDDDGLLWIMMLELTVLGCLYGSCGIAFLIVVCTVASRQNFKYQLHGCCTDAPICCLGLWCPCVLWGQNASFGMGDYDQVLKQPAFGCLIYLCGTCIAQAICGIPIYCCLGMMSRGPIRKKVGIDGEVWEDVCIHLFGHQCALCQEQREIQDAEDQGRVRQLDRRGRVIDAESASGIPTAIATVIVPNMPIAVATVAQHADALDDNMPTEAATVNSTGPISTSNPLVPSSTYMSSDMPTATWGVPAGSGTAPPHATTASPVEGMLSDVDFANMANGTNRARAGTGGQADGDSVLGV